MVGARDDWSMSTRAPATTFGPTRRYGARRAAASPPPCVPIELTPWSLATSTVPSGWRLRNARTTCATCPSTWLHAPA